MKLSPAPLLAVVLVVGGGCGPAAPRAVSAPVRPVAAARAAAPPAVRPACAPASRPGATPATRPATAPAAAAGCPAWIVTYELGPGTTLKITDTTLGAGNGTFAVGPGRATLRVAAGPDGQPAPGPAALLELEVPARFTVNASALGFKTRVASDLLIRFTPDRCGVVARGALEGARVVWSEPARGYRATGTLTCSGTCGHFGAPPAGRSATRTGPYPVKLAPFTVGPGLHELAMPYVQVERSSSPKQRTLLKLGGRETGRLCAPPPPCP
jgi:hypothetical protein